MKLTCLPHDILVCLIDLLNVPELGALASTCWALHTVVSQYGWSGYLRDHPRSPSYSLAKAQSRWSAQTRARYHALTDTAWKTPKFIARPLCRMWHGKLQPLLAINDTRLIVGAGNTIYSYIFSDSGEATSPSVSLEGTISLTEPPERPKNITGLAFIDDQGEDRTFLIAFQDGTIDQVTLHSNQTTTDQPSSLSITRTPMPPMPGTDFIESISSQSHTTLSLSSTGFVRLTNSQTNIESLISLNTRSWSSLLSMDASTPFAVLGTSSKTPLNVHHILPTGILSTHPSAILHTRKSKDTPLDQLGSSAVYGIAHGPPNAPWGASPNIIVSGWYDGHVRCYDLRSPSSSNPHTSQRPLRPFLSLADRWSYEPIYSVSCGGGSGSHIAAGSARHSLVSFWDVRAPSAGWSVHAPGDDNSPVHSVILESSRCFGVTQSRAFVYDFGPGVNVDTYPPIPITRGIDNLKRKKYAHPATFKVFRYDHQGSGIAYD